jgi:hypothetical protein
VSGTSILPLIKPIVFPSIINKGCALTNSGIRAYINRVPIGQIDGDRRKGGSRAGSGRGIVKYQGLHRFNDTIIHRGNSDIIAELARGNKYTVADEITIHSVGCSTSDAVEHQPHGIRHGKRNGNGKIYM